MKWLRILVTIVISVSGVSSVALRPATVGEIAASTGQISNRLKDSAAWKRLTSGQTPNSFFVRTLPARAMEVVREVVGTFRNEGRVLLLTPNGVLRGRHQPNKSGIPGSYYSFRGIKYGQAPVGRRRFRQALPELPWKGIRNALREGASCPHRNMLLDTFKGDEDCLFLNVYTPELPNKSRHPTLPVMFWVHGGAFAFGSGNSFLYGPDFLVAEGIVLVTINYRLGPLGFLGAGGDAPGNAGLKDQVLALKWVQENIAAFGGDPNSVTVFGESAGAASVQYLMLSPLTRGLFHKAISQSGSVLNPWAFAEQPKQRAFRLGEVLGFETNNTQKLVDFLRTVPVRKLIDATKKTLTQEDDRRNTGLPFVPSIEDSPELNNYFEWDSLDKENIEESGDLFEEEERFLTEHPLTILKEGKFHNIPFLTGFNTEEALLFIRRLKVDPKLLSKLDSDFSRVVPNDFDVSSAEEEQKVAQNIREFYLGDRPAAIESIDDLIKLWTDLMFMRGIVNGARYHANSPNSTVFFYRFGFDGALGLYKRLLGIQRPGVCHGDELGYLFHFGFFNLSLDPRSPEILMKKRMVAMWTNFAKYGNPTQSANFNNDLGVDWIPMTSQSESDDLNYLDINRTLSMRTNPSEDRLQFWDNLSQTYNGRLL